MTTWFDQHVCVQRSIGQTGLTTRRLAGRHRPLHQRLESIDIDPDDIKAAAPEIRGSDVDAEASSE